MSVRYVGIVINLPRKLANKRAKYTSADERVHWYGELHVHALTEPMTTYVEENVTQDSEDTAPNSSVSCSQVRQTKSGTMTVPLMRYTTEIGERVSYAILISTLEACPPHS